jgi:tetratricopeptide (TPR) repeat protein
MFRRRRSNPSIGAEPQPDLVELGIQLRRQYEQTGDERALELSVIALESILPEASPGSEYRRAALAALGLSLRARYQRSGASADLDRAVALHEEAAAVVLPDSPHVAGMLSNLAGSLRLRYERDGDADDLGRAVDAYRRAVAATPPGSPWRSTFLSNLGNGLHSAYQHGGDPADLEAGVRAFQEAVSNVPPGSVGHAGAFASLAGALGERYLLTGDPGDAEAALEAAERAVADGSGTAGEPEYRAALAVALTRLYTGSGRLEYLDRAIAEEQEAIRRTPQGSTKLPSRLSNLAGSFDLRHRVTGDPGELDQAIEMYQAAVSLQSEDTPDASYRYGNLGSSHLRRYEDSGDRADLDAAVTTLERAVGAAERLGSARQVLRETARLANALVSRYDQDGRPEDLDRAVAGHEHAASGLPSGTHGQLTSLLSLAADLARRHALRGEAADRERASEAFRRGCRGALERGPELALRGARTWSAFAAELGAWPEAAEAGRLALQASRCLFVAQALRPHREAWLRTAQGLPSETAYALAKSGDLDGAVVALEQGQALLLSEALDHQRVRFDDLAAGGHRELVERYRLAAASVNQLEREEMDRPATMPQDRAADALRRARQELAAVVDDIRRLPGYADFLHHGDGDGIAAADVPLVYLLAHPLGGLALLVHRDVPTTAVWLPALKGEAFLDEFAAYARAYGSPDPASLAAALDRLTGWLWRAAMGPLLDLLPTGGEVRVVPVGVVALLPLHAAWTNDPSSHDGRRYVLDTVTLTYAPNAGAFRAAAERAGAARAERVLAVGEPQPVQAGPLPHATTEARAVRQLFPGGQLLVGPQATRERVLRGMGEHEIHHLACHGQANIRTPLASALLLAGDEPLTLRELLTRRLPGVRLTVLSACESAVPGVVLPDEVIGLPAGLLQAGVAGVISSQWPVADASTMMLMVRFYQLWRVDGLAPAESLRQAQLWVRNSTNGEKERLFPGVEAFAGPDGSAAARSFWAAGRSWTHPYHWAAFTYVGS